MTSGRALQVDRPPNSGVLVIAPDEALESLVPMRYSVSDVSASGGGAVAAASSYVYALEGGAARAVWHDRRLDYTAIDINDAGTVFVGTRDCDLNAVVRLEPDTDDQSNYIPREITVSDEPHLLGPRYPLALAAGEELVVMQGDYSVQRYSGSETVVGGYGYSSVQRWSLDGALRGQWTRCSSKDPTDVTLDGDDAYFVDREFVRTRQQEDWTIRTLFSSGTENVAGTANGGRIATLPAGSEEILIHDRDGNEVAAWPYEILGDGVVPVDVAMDGDMVYVADIGGKRVIAATLEGTVVAEFGLHDIPRAIEVGPDGDVFALGRRGWAARYDPGGEMEAVWRLPERWSEQDLTATDLAVDVRGTVYVSFAGVVRPDDSTRTYVREAGVWVFEEVDDPTHGIIKPPPDPGACLAEVDKSAAPAQVRLGGSVAVTLGIAGHCPGHAEPHQVMIVFDTSRSMSWNDSDEEAQDAVVVLLEALDPTVGDVGLVSFSDEASLDVQLSDDIAGMRARVMTLRATGDTFFGVGIARAHEELVGPRGDPGAKRTIMIVTDGQMHDDPTEEVAAATADGIDFLVLVFPNTVSRRTLEPKLTSVFGEDAPVHYDPLPREMPDIARPARNWVDEPGLFQSVTIVDEIPANMSYMPDSAEPAVTLAGSTLRWTLPAVSAADGVALSYRLVPSELGTHPTNVKASADYVDALGNSGALQFPVPVVEVLHRPPQDLFLPIGLKESLKPAEYQTADIVLVIDSSSSMSGDKIAAARDAASTFARMALAPDGLVTQNVVAVVSFNSSSRVVAWFTGYAEYAAAKIQSIRTAPGTRIDLGLAEALDALEDLGRRSGRDQVVVLLTDGRQPGSPDPVFEQVDRAHANGVIVYTIGLGADVDVDLIVSAATYPEYAYFAPTASDLEDIYELIARRLPCDPSDYWSRRCP